MEKFNMVSGLLEPNVKGLDDCSSSCMTESDDEREFDEAYDDLEDEIADEWEQEMDTYLQQANDELQRQLDFELDSAIQKELDKQIEDQMNQYLEQQHQERTDELALDLDRLLSLQQHKKLFQPPPLLVIPSVTVVEVDATIQRAIQGYVNSGVSPELP
jgi:hypothetical protein